MRSRLLLLFSAFFCLSALASAQPTGIFLVGESEGDDFQRRLTLNGERGTLSALEPAEAPSVEFTVTAIGARLYHLLGTEQGGPFRAYLRFRTDHDALMWVSGQNRLFLALRQADTSLEELQGEWKALVADQLTSVHLTGDQLVLPTPSGELRARLLPLVPDAEGEVRMVAVPQDRDSFLLYFVALEPNLWLLRNHEEDDFVLLFRGETPPWVNSELKARREQQTLVAPPE